MEWNQQCHGKSGKGACSKLREAVIPLLDEQTCYSCQGARINPLARHVTIQDVAIQDLCRIPIEQALHFIQELKIDQQEKC